MSNQLQTQIKAKPQPFLTPLSAGLLQRTCACGGTPSVDSECAECRENRLSLQHNTSDQQYAPISTPTAPLPGHSLSRIQVYADNPTMLQTKLVVNEPGDKYEQEADQVAERVMGSLESGYTQTTNLSGNTYSNSIQHKHPQGEELNRQPEQEEGEREEDETLQAKTVSSEKPVITPEIQTHINSIKGNGQALPKLYQYPMETHFGHDFSKVKIHTDTNAAETARALHARAYTINQDIVFGAGQYAPETYEGKKLLAHELTHVVQQMPDAATPQRVDRQSETQPLQQQTDIEQRLIEETIRLAKSPITFLHGAYIRKALEERKSRKHLLEVFNSAFQHILAQRESDNRKLIQLIGTEAHKLIQTVELEFIRDPQASTLDLLPGDKGQKYRNFLWGKNDFPGNEPLKGEQEDEQTKQLRLEHQKEARKMAGALSEVRPERRVNTGKAAVMTKSEFHWEYVDSQMVPVKGQGGHRLNHHANDSFIKMQADALQDGVDLVILSSDRTPSKAKRNAARAGNPTAVAKFSAHTLGLAVDLQMSQGKQEFKEITTRPMSNVVGMHQSPVHKWLFLHGAAYGWYPYQNEPWHWEYNPSGFREKFQEDMQKEAAKSSSTSDTTVLQRSANGLLPSHIVPQSVHEVLGSPGQPLNTSTRSFMESRLGHDFSNVRVHTDTRAAESARAVNALAYTVGRNIVFGSGHYAPGTSEGKRLVAHELTHVVQQRHVSDVSRGGPILLGPIGGTYEQEANYAGKTLLPGKGSLSSVATPTLQRFAPEGHREATIESLRGSYSAEEIGRIYEANWERDFSQGPIQIADMVAAWKALKLSAMKSNDGMPSKEAIDRFNGTVMTVLNMSIWAATRESLGGYHYWEHMDNPGKAEADKRWQKVKEKPTGIPGYILDSREYIKDRIVDAVNTYRTANKMQPLAIKNWQGVKPPSGYKAPQAPDEKKQEKPIRQQTTVMAIKAGAESSTNSTLPPGTTANLGQAMHALEDFFAHSNWLEMAKEMRTGGQPTQTLHTGTFEMPDKVQALGHKLVSLAIQLQQEQQLLLRTFGIKEKKDVPNVITPTSSTQLGEIYDVKSAGSRIGSEINKGKLRLIDFLTSEKFLNQLKAKGEHMMERGEKEAPKTGHANLAKDAPEPGKESEYESAIQYAISADRLVFVPLRAVMEKQEASEAEKMLVQQLSLVNDIIAPPSKDHPLLRPAMKEGDYPLPSTSPGATRMV